MQLNPSDMLKQINQKQKTPLFDIWKTNMKILCWFGRLKIIIKSVFLATIHWFITDYTDSMCLWHFKNIVKSGYKETHLQIHLKNDKPTHNFFNIISYDRTRYTDIHFGNNTIKGSERIILMLCFCLHFFCFLLQLLYVCWLSACSSKGHTPKKTRYMGKGLAMNRPAKSFSHNCQQFSNSHEDRLITNSRPRHCNPLHNCNDENRINLIKEHMGLSFKKSVEFDLYPIKQIIWEEERDGICILSRLIEFLWYM